MGRRNTIQKELVYDAVMKMHGHVTADEIYEYIKNEHPSIGKGTVYRNLGILSEENKIRRIEVPNGADRFDFRADKHYHMRCQKCDNFFDIDMDEVKGLETKINDKQGMIFFDYDIVFKGICTECQKKADSGI